MTNLKKIKASFLLIFIMLLLTIVFFSHSIQAHLAYDVLMDMNSSKEAKELYQGFYNTHVMYDIATAVLGIAAFIVVLFVRKREKILLEDEKVALEREMEAESQELQMLIAANIQIAQAKEQFLVMFTHELKTPLNAIINFSKYISKKTSEMSEGKKIAELANSIHRNGQSMLDTVSNLLETARIKNGKISVTNETIFVSAMVGDIFDKYKSLTDEKNATNETQIDKNMIVTSDRYHLEHILSNIYTNALKYGNGKILVSAAYQDPRGWFVSIEDNGDGISDTQKALKLFEQVGVQGLQRHSQGTGVGLYFCKILCEELDFGLEISSSSVLGGAKITITSKEGQK
jgi:signal transduction histidine kinase